MRDTREDLASLAREVSECTRCPRLVAYREQVGREKVRRFSSSEYWARPVPGFGDCRAQIWVIGLAPAAHGGNRTGRIFTGDRSGGWLFAALHRAGLANQPTSVARGDGLAVQGVYISAVVRCAPPDNKPSTDERERCQGYLERELAMLPRVTVFVALGGFAFTNLLRVLKASGDSGVLPVRFGHGAVVGLRSGRTVIGCYHPSQQNTFTGRLTEPMLDDVFREAKRRAAG